MLGIGALQVVENGAVFLDVFAGLFVALSRFYFVPVTIQDGPRAIFVFNRGEVAPYMPPEIDAQCGELLLELPEAPYCRHDRWIALGLVELLRVRRLEILARVGVGHHGRQPNLL